LLILISIMSVVHLYPEQVSAQTQIKASILPGASTMGDKAFSPNPLNIKVGDSITWTNNDSTVHTVTSGTGPTDPNMGKEFDSGLKTLMSPGDTFSFTFSKTGEFPYYCAVHPTMVGTIIVS
ncbi:MAG: cupredoxin domain-containing protein, partial [Nitrososphaeraceae archaeon]